MKQRRIPFAALTVAGLALFVALAAGTTLFISGSASLRGAQKLLAERAEMQLDDLERQLDTVLRPVEAQAAWLAAEFDAGRLAPEGGAPLGALLAGALAATPQVEALCILDGRGEATYRQRGARERGDGCASADSPGAPPGWRVARRASGPPVLVHEFALRRDGRDAGRAMQIVPVAALSRALAAWYGAARGTPFLLAAGDRVLAHPALAGGAGDGSDLPGLDGVGDAVLARLRTPDPIDPVGMRALSGARAAAALIAGERHLFISRELVRARPAPWILGFHVGTGAGGQLAEIQRVGDAAAAGLAVLALAILAAAIAGRRIARPLRSLADAARQVGEGPLERVAPLPASAIAELDVASHAFNRMVDGLRERDLIRDILGRFVSEEVARGLLAGKGTLEPVHTEATALLCDIEGFAALTDARGPGGTVAFLNAYFEAMAGCVERRGGVITQFQGDAVLAVFNIPLRDEDHAANALRAIERFIACGDPHHGFAQPAPTPPAAPAIAQTLPLPYGQDINLETATVAMNAAVAHARSRGWNVTIVVVDSAGQVVTLNRFDNAHKASAAFATAKANSAAMTKRSTKILADQLASGRNAILGFVDLHVHVAEGGEVIVQNGRIVGAIGAAGVTQEQDREISLAGVAAVAAR